MAASEFPLSTNTKEAEAAERALATLERMTAGGAAGAIAAVRAEFERLRGIIERDRTIFANATKRMLAELRGRMWMVESRGSYEYDDKRFQDEFGEAVTALRAEVEAIRELGRGFSDCPSEQATVDAIHAGVTTVLAAHADAMAADWRVAAQRALVLGVIDADAYDWLQLYVRDPQAAASVATAQAPKADGRFGHHADPANDFCIEVECLTARLYNARIGFNKSGLEPETVESVQRDIERALQFRVGGDPIAVRAMQELRGLRHPAPAATEAAQA
jgi:hypothetical protein